MSTHVCVVCGATEAEFTCGFCRIPRYCARLCQKKDHQRHKQECSDKVMERRRKKEEEEETKLSKELKKVSVEDQKQYTEMLCTGVKEENLRLIQLLLAKDETNVNEVGSEGFSPLWLACESGLISVVEILLLADGIDVNQAETTVGVTPLFIACENGHTPVVELLLASSGIAVNQATTNNRLCPLFIACQNGHTPVVELLLAANDIDINQARTMDGCTPLYVACQNGHAPVVELLLALSEIAVNQARTDDGTTPFYKACQKGHALVVELLLAASGIDINIGPQDWSPLRVARQTKHTEIVQLLVDAGAQ